MSEPPSERGKQRRKPELIDDIEGNEEAEEHYFKQIRDEAKKLNKARELYDKNELLKEKELKELQENSNNNLPNTNTGKLTYSKKIAKWLDPMLEKIEKNKKELNSNNNKTYNKSNQLLSTSTSKTIPSTHTKKSVDSFQANSLPTTATVASSATATVKKDIKIKSPEDLTFDDFLTLVKEDEELKQIMVSFLLIFLFLVFKNNYVFIFLLP